MNVVRGFVVLLLVALLMNACTTGAGKERVRVLCPACGTDFDAFFYQRY